MLIARTSLVSLSGIKSSYSKKHKPREKLDVSAFREGALVTPDVEKILHAVDEKIRSLDGEFYITDLYRSFVRQKQAREEYESGKKKDYVAEPGSSWHNAARAVDIDINNLNFRGVDKKKWLQTFWDNICPLGLIPIIKMPDMKASEAWHFDMPGEDWFSIYSKLPYGRVAKCAILDIGRWDESIGQTSLSNMFIQAQLIRLGNHGIGEVDGIIGRKTGEALRKLSLFNRSTEDIIEELKKM